MAITGGIEFRREKFNAAQMTDANSFGRLYLTNPEELTPVITKLAGYTDDSISLLFLTEGMNSSVEKLGTEFEYKIIGGQPLARPVVVGNSSPALGLGHAPFTLTFADSYFIKDYLIQSSSDTQARILKVERTAMGYEYTLQLIQPDRFLDPKDASTGAMWSSLYAPVAQQWSRGNASNSSTMGKAYLRLAKMRKSYQYAGDAANYVVSFDLPINGKKTRYWMNYEMYLREIEWRKEILNAVIYGQRNYDDRGVTTLLDENSRPVITSPGLFEQIGNVETYSKLTASRLKNVIGDLFYGKSEKEASQIIIYTGSGGMREFDEAMKSELNKTWIVGEKGQFIKGDGSSLALTGYFKEYQHIDGHTVKLKKLPLFDEGAIAQTRGKHPETGWSLESYRMMILDQNNYDGVPNVLSVHQKGQTKTWVVLGGADGPNGEAPKERASDIDGSSIHYMATKGLVVRRTDCCLDLKCEAS